MDFEHCTVELVIRTPERKTFSLNVSLDRNLYRRSLAPLPRNREIPWDMKAYYEAAEQAKLRRHMIRCIAEQLAVDLLKLVESQDTDHGYPKPPL